MGVELIGAEGHSLQIGMSGQVDLSVSFARPNMNEN